MEQINIIHNQDCMEGLKQYPDQFFHCCVTSPPYWGLRDYGVAGQIGLEQSPDDFVDKLVGVFREVKRTLRDDGTLWVNIGDCYSHNGAAYGSEKSTLIGRRQGEEMGKAKRFVKEGAGLKPKDLVGIPWLLAFALRDDGWYLRDCIIWHKPNPMPESVTDRTTKAHEYIFLLTKSAKYYSNFNDIKEDAVSNTRPREKLNGESSVETKERGYGSCCGVASNKRNKRSVWTINVASFEGGHFATFPEELPYTCMLAGCPPDGIVLDPFMGAGTTALVARKLQRQYVGFELNSKYVEIAERRLQSELGMFK